MTHFTKTPPADPGWYWWRLSPNHHAQVYRLDWFKGESLWFWRCGETMPNPVEEYGEWAGPIEPPDDSDPDLADALRGMSDLVDGYNRGESQAREVLSRLRMEGEL